MWLEDLLDRCAALETRTATLYRSFAAASRSHPDLCALWTALAREEETHAHAIAIARQRCGRPSLSQTRLDGWSEALAEVERRLEAGERLGPAPRPEDQLGAALAIEASEIDAMRDQVLRATAAPAIPEADHAERLASAAAAYDDPELQLQAALIRARARLARG